MRRPSYETRKLVGLALTACISSFGHSQWSMVPDTGPVVVNGVSPSPNGFLAISSGLYNTTDNGSTWNYWQPTSGGLPIIGIWKDAHFFDGQTGIMVGAFDLNNQYGVMRTTDGGVTWQPVSVSSVGNWPRRLEDVHFPSATVGYAVGTNGRLLKTTNGGFSWSTLSNVLDGSDATSVWFMDPNVGLVAGVNGVGRTINGGTSWSTVLSASGRFVLSGNSNGVLAAASPGKVYISIDAGLTWAESNAPSMDPVSIVIIDPTQVMIIANDLGACFSTSGGAYWELADIPGDAILKDVHFNNALNGCIVGLHEDNGLILVSNTGFGAGLPIANLSTSSTQACGSTTLTFTASGLAPDWTVAWTMDGQLVGTGNTVSLTFDETTYATVFAEVSNNTHTRSIPWSGTVAVSQPFSIDAGDDVALCSGNSAVLSITAPSGTSFQWSPTTGLSQPTSASPTVTDIEGTITYTVTATNGSCASSDQVTVSGLEPIPADDWVQILSTTTDVLFDFTDAFNGYAVSTDTLHITHDGGLTWNKLAAPVSGNISDNMNMVDPFVGYAANNSGLRRTTDGWNTFTSIQVGPSGGYFRAIHVKDRNTVLIVSEPASSGSRTLSRTVDGGISWNNVLTDIPHRIHDIVFVNDSIVLGAGGTGVDGTNVNSMMIRSIDGGSTWSVGPFPGYNGRISDLEVRPDGVLFAVGVNSRIFQSSDQGVTWQSILVTTAGAAGGTEYITFVDNETGFARLNGGFFKTINGGACWQQMAPNMPAPATQGMSTGGLTFFRAGNPPRQIRRTGTPAAGLQFALNGDTICAGDPPLAVNNSIGYEQYTWLLDGQTISNDVHPTIPLTGPGVHSLTLIGQQNGDTDTLTKAFHVQEFTMVPILSLMEQPCWIGDVVPLMATTNDDVLGYQWYRYDNLNQLMLLGGGNPLNIMPAQYGITYFARAISLAGCPGPLSDSITVVATDAIPSVYLPNGPNSVCIWGGSNSTTYTGTALPGSSDVTDFAWSLQPGSAGTLDISGNSCTVNWSPGFEGYANLSVSGIDACGIGPPSTRNIQVDIGSPITLQPFSQTVPIGGSFLLQVGFDPPAAINGTWRKDGLLFYTNVASLVVENATPSMSGEYYWDGFVSNICGWVYSDTVTITVADISTPTGEVPGGALPQFIVRPNPAMTDPMVDIPELTDPAEMVLYDVNGQEVLRRALSAGPMRTEQLRMAHLGPGTYSLSLKGDGLYLRAVLIKVD
jgi:photosystem II stability/assembly factor-like uncharacterized protein